MSERKVLTKYYPPDFDPSAIGRTPKHLRKQGPKVITVRLMAPFPMKCTNCGEYIYRGRKFNARKQTLEEKYLNIPIYRFFIRCTRCSGEITFRTDPKNMDYECEKGAKRNFEPWRDSKSGKYNETEEETLDRLEREENAEHEQQERDKMADGRWRLRMRWTKSVLEMRVDESRLQAEREDEEAARKAFMTADGERIKRIVDEEEEPTPAAAPVSAEPKPAASISMPPPSSTSFSRVKKTKKSGNLLGIKKKPSLV
ncbi:unnamed protein product [Penicillium pancosmium]